MNPRTRRAALYVIGAIAILASVNALAHSYTGLYDWALHHRLGGWQALSWPAEIDVFLIVGELALYVAYLDAWERRYKLWPWVTAITGLGISVAGNVGHVQSLPGSPVTLADRLTAATSPVAAFAGLMVGLLVLKMTREVAPARGTSGEVKVTPWLLPADEPFTDATQVDGASAVADLPDPWSAKEDVPLLADAAEILGAARICGERVSQRALAEQLRERGHRFSNAQLREIVITADSVAERRAALHDSVRSSGRLQAHHVDRCRC
jgi:hypothetical protein